MSDLTGSLIMNRYDVREFLGRGGMAEVYMVWDKQRSVYLAMKVLRDDLAEDLIFIRRFKREASHLSQLQHPHIVRFYDMEEDGDLVFLLMDYIEGTTLRKEIFKTKVPFSLEKINSIMQPVCSALTYAHSLGLAHCDVKPANIMLHKNGTVFLADFGIARMTEGTSTMTMAGGAGTPAYMAPEQAMGEDPTNQTDVYALGIVLYEMLTGGERPFTGEAAQITGATSEKLRWEQQNLSPTPPSRINPQISKELESVVMRCLEKLPENRYRSVIDLLNALQMVIGLTADQAQGRNEAPQEPAIIQKNPLTKPETAHFSNWKRLLPWIVASGSAMVVCIALTILGGNQAKRLVPILIEGTVTQAAKVPVAATSEPGNSKPLFTNSPDPTPNQLEMFIAGDTQISPVDNMVMVYIPSGIFIMGSEDGKPDEKPEHEVFLDGYWIDRMEVTNGMYRLCLNANACTRPFTNGSSMHTNYFSNNEFSNYPMINIDWTQASEYCKWAGRELPTEAQWEKAARGMDKPIYPWGDSIDINRANYGKTIGDTSVVDSYNDGVSLYQVYNMAGNVSEWVADWYDENYYRSMETWNNPVGPGPTVNRIFRGGSWEDDASQLRSSFRGAGSPLLKNNTLGFRCSLKVK